MRHGARTGFRWALAEMVTDADSVVFLLHLDWRKEPAGREGGVLKQKLPVFLTWPQSRCIIAASPYFKVKFSAQTWGRKWFAAFHDGSKTGLQR